MIEEMFLVYPLIYPVLPTNCDLPPELYYILESIVNYDKEENEKVKIKDLAKYGRTEIFDFEYPLSTHIDKEKFETLILNHFLLRRINFDTVTAFKIALNVKLNEIMPEYNKMFDMLNNWNIFNDGEVATRSLSDSTSIVDVNNGSASNNTQVAQTTGVMSTNTSDRRFSNVPENALADVRSGQYVTEYNYDENGLTENTTNNTTQNNNTITSNTTNTNNNKIVSETITRSPSDKMRLYEEFMLNTKHIYTLIFKELEPLFYGLV